MNELQEALAYYFGSNSNLSNQLIPFFKEETLSKGAFHTRLDSWNTQLSFVRSGHLRIYRQTDKKEVTQWISSNGEFCTELNAFMFEQPARFNIQALTDCRLLSIDQESYKKMSQSVSQWSELERLFIGKCFVTLEDRIFTFLSMTTEERYHFFMEHRPELFQQIPQQYLASILGMTPETFSRIRGKSIS